VLARIIEAAALTGNETVCEAGTGNGVLTKELCRHARHVVSYEVDRALHQNARAAMPFHNLELVHGDLFKARDVKFDVFVSNLPYSRSRDALEWLATQSFRRAVIMVQSEFAEKLAARPGSRNYRAISTIASHCFSMERLFDVGPGAFLPPPSVDSVVLRLTLIRAVTAETIKKVNLLFSKRNKKASSVAKKMGLAKDYGQKRVGQLAPAELMELVGDVPPG
jgi:16S rRNA (adenine1518-N6/adenine1519-N6)-dimethyltransferase